MTATSRSSGTQSRIAPLTGTALGRYLVGDRLGSGGAASVYLGLLRGPHNWERVLALKVIHEHLLDETEFVNMFLDEANLSVHLTHPNIVHTYELGQADGQLFLAMEYLEGVPLSRVLSACKANGERLPFDLVAWVFARAAEGLGYAHDKKGSDGQLLGIVHRDVSPQNVFLTYDGQVKVIDFGIARAAGRLTETGLGKIKGKVRYMAPEQILSQEFDHRVDLFALGAACFEAAVGEPPYDAEDETEALAKLVGDERPDPRKLVADFPDELAGVLARTLEREPESRYQKASEIARALDAFVSSSSDRDCSSELATLLVRLFEGERAQRAAAVARLKASSVEPDRESRFDTTVRRIERIEQAASELPPRRVDAPNRLRWIAIGVTALVLTGVAIFALAPSGTPEQPVAAPETTAADTVAIEVTVQPNVEATITIGGEVVDERPARITVDRGSDDLKAAVAADGYETAHATITPDRDRSVVVSLVKTARPDPEPTAATPEPSAAPPPRSVQRPARKQRSAPPTPKERPKGSLVTEYPF